MQSFVKLIVVLRVFDPLKNNTAFGMIVPYKHNMRIYKFSFYSVYYNNSVRYNKKYFK